MPYGFIAAIITAAITAFFIYGYVQKLNLRKRFMGNYFDWDSIEYDFESLSIIRRYWDAHNKFDKPDRIIDDTTWDDLDMDYVFFSMNANHSSVGEEYMYARLREVSHDESSLVKFNDAADFMEKSHEARAEALCALHSLGKNLYNNVNSYIYKIDEQPLKNIKKYYMLMAFLLISILCCFITPLGFALVLAAFIVNTLIYYRDKYLIDSNLSSMAYISKMMGCAYELSKLDYNGLDYSKKLQDAIKPLRNISRLGNSLFKKLGNELEAVFEYVKIVLMWDFINYNRFIGVLSKNREAFHQVYRLIGEIDCAISVSLYRQKLEFYTKPVFADADEIISQEIYHPLIKKPVCNSIEWKKNAIITGSNASGKSTFVKALAINMIFAQSLFFCFAKYFSTKRSSVMTSMAVRDMVYADESYFVAEIKSLKRILDKLNKETRIVCFIDEILKGTNTIERIAASAAILHWLSTKNCLVMVASHDIELTEIMRLFYDNYHFREQVQDEGIFFDYKLYGGYSRTRNAIKLLDFMGYDKQIWKRAEALSSHFNETGRWDIFNSNSL